MALLSNPSENDDDIPANEPSKAVQVDHELLLEEQLAQIVAANKVLQQERSQLQELVKRLNESVETLQRKNVSFYPMDACEFG